MLRNSFKNVKDIRKKIHFKIMQTWQTSQIERCSCIAKGMFEESWAHLIVLAKQKGFFDILILLDEVQDKGLLSFGIITTSRKRWIFDTDVNPKFLIFSSYSKDWEERNRGTQVPGTSSLFWNLNLSKLLSRGTPGGTWTWPSISVQVPFHFHIGKSEWKTAHFIIS